MKAAILSALREGWRRARCEVFLDLWIAAAVLAVAIVVYLTRA